MLDLFLSKTQALAHHQSTHINIKTVSFREEACNDEQQRKRSPMPHGGIYFTLSECYRCVRSRKSERQRNRIAKPPSTHIIVVVCFTSKSKNCGGESLTHFSKGTASLAFTL